jgi:hypothetical protein
MPCIDPKTVLSPKGLISNLSVLFDGGEWDEANPDWSGWSLGELIWDGDPAVGIRWNGDPNAGVGNPQSRGVPTWMILPKPIAEVAVDRVRNHLHGDDDAAAEIPPRRRLLDLISFVRAASDEELTQMIDQMELRPRSSQPARTEQKETA